MSQVTVQEILEKIDQLPADDRLLLEQQLAERAEREWQQAAHDARRLACERGVDQATIDRTIHDLRYSP